MSRQDLFDAMVSRHHVMLIDPMKGENYGYINGIKVEDGSGYSFIVTLNTKFNGTYQNVDIYYRCKS